MQISGHRTRSVFDRYHIVSPRDIKEAVSKIEQYRSGPNLKMKYLPKTRRLPNPYSFVSSALIPHHRDLARLGVFAAEVANRKPLVCVTLADPYDVAADADAFFANIHETFTLRFSG